MTSEFQYPCLQNEDNEDTKATMQGCYKACNLNSGDYCYCQVARMEMGKWFRIRAKEERAREMSLKLVTAVKWKGGENAINTF